MLAHPFMFISHLLQLLFPIISKNLSVRLSVVLKSKLYAILACDRVERVNSLPAPVNIVHDVWVDVFNDFVRH